MCAVMLPLLQDHVAATEGQEMPGWVPDLAEVGTRVTSTLLLGTTDPALQDSAALPIQLRLRRDGRQSAIPRQSPRNRI